MHLYSMSKPGCFAAEAVMLRVRVRVRPPNMIIQSRPGTICILQSICKSRADHMHRRYK